MWQKPVLRWHSMITPRAVIESRLKTQSRTQLASDLDISESYLRDIIRQRRPASEKVVKGLGLELVYRWRKSGNGK